MIFKSIAVASSVAISMAADANTVTKTNYIYPPGFEDQIASIMAANPSGLQNGIQVKFVYETPSTSEPAVAATAPAQAPVQPDQAAFQVPAPVQASAQAPAGPVEPQDQPIVVQSTTSSVAWFANPLQSVAEPSESSVPSTPSSIAIQETTATATTVPQSSLQSPVVDSEDEEAVAEPETVTVESTDEVTSTALVTQSQDTEEDTSTAKIQKQVTIDTTTTKSKAAVTQQKQVTTTKATTKVAVVTQTTKPTTVVTSSKVTYQTLADVTVVHTITTDGVESTVQEIVQKTIDATSEVTYTTTATTTEASTLDETITSTKEAKTIDQTTTTTNNKVITAQPSTVYKTHSIIYTTAVTTTKTVFSATTIPTTTYIEPSETHMITITQENPLVTRPVVTATVDKTIATSTFTEDVTLTQATTIVSTETKGSNVTDMYTTVFKNTTVISGSTSTELATVLVTANSTTFNFDGNAVVPESTELSESSEAGVVTSVIPLNITSVIPLNITLSATGYANATDNSSVVVSTSYSTVISTSSIVTSWSVSIAGESSLAEESSIIESSSQAVETSSAQVSSSAQSSSAQSSSVEPSSEAAPSPAESSAVVDSNGIAGSYSGQLFSSPIDTSEPPQVFSRQDLPLGVPSGVDQDKPFQTNKFYSNLFLGAQTDEVFSWPYGLFWRKVDYYGFAIQHNDPKSIVFGSEATNNENVPSYFYNPTQQGELLFSSTDLGENNNHIRVKNQHMMSVTVELSANSDDTSNYVEIPIVQGMGFATAIYHGSVTALINSVIGIQTLTKESSNVLPSNVQKYRASLFGGTDWLIYVTLPDGAPSDFAMTAENPYNVKASTSVDGLIIQVAKAPQDGLNKRDGESDEGYYDQSAGMYVDGCSLGGSAAGGVAQYSFDYSTQGTSKSGAPLVFVLPHHDETITGDTKNYATGLKLASTTKGQMSGYLTPQIIMQETLNTGLGFLPQVDGQLTYTKDQLSLMASSANEELSVSIPDTVSGMGSNYFSGKVIDKYAYILLVISDVLQDDDVAKSTLAQLQKAFDEFINNKQTYPLMYDTRYKGVTSSSAQEGDTGADFGSSYYNDHHFHYGYFIHAAAIVGYVDKKYGGTWAEDNKEWVNSLIRDVANPSEDDSYFPQSRSFDWFSGHSWAAGLFASGDGKNQESSSEDYNFTYGMKLWGKVIGDGAMEARADLMLAITNRSMNKYIYFSDGNDIVPEEYLPNRVAGIIFENKMAYTTFFGSPDKNPEYVHGIHMVPLTPVSQMIRGSTYVKQEWDDQVSTFINNVDSGWTGILKLNQALYDPKSSLDFFSAGDWNSNHLDNGMSRTWSLAFAAGLANAA